MLCVAGLRTETSGGEAGLVCKARTANFRRCLTCQPSSVSCQPPLGAGPVVFGMNKEARPVSVGVACSLYGA